MDTQGERPPEQVIDAIKDGSDEGDALARQWGDAVMQMNHAEIKSLGHRLAERMDAVGKSDAAELFRLIIREHLEVFAPELLLEES